MSVDLATVLTGGNPAQAAPRPPRADVVTTLHCDCGPGALLAVMHRTGGRTRVWKRGYRHTRRGTADLLMHTALEDFEAIARIAHEHPELDDPGLSAEVRAIAEFVKVDSSDLAVMVPPLTVPARDQDVTGIGAHFTALAAERPGLVTLPSGFLTECGNCRLVRDLGEAVLHLEPNPSPPPRVAVEDAPRFGMPAVSYEWPEGARSARVALYRQLSAVLT